MNIIILEAMGKRFNDSIILASEAVQNDPSKDTVKKSINELQRVKVHIENAIEETKVEGFKELLSVIDKNVSLMKLLQNEDF